MMSGWVCRRDAKKGFTYRGKTCRIVPTIPPKRWILLGISPEILGGRLSTEEAGRR